MVRTRAWERSRRSLRLPFYDYSKPAGYFVTLVTFQREQLLGRVMDGKMVHSEAGKIVWEVWQSLPHRYPNIILDEAVVMPDHFHGIVVIKAGTAHDGTALDETALDGTALDGTALAGTALDGTALDETALDGTALDGTAIHELPFRLDEVTPERPFRLDAESPELRGETYRLTRRRMLLPLAIGYLKMNSAKRINLLLGNPGERVWHRNYYERIIRDDLMLARVRAYIRANPAKWGREKEKQSGYFYHSSGCGNS